MLCDAFAGASAQHTNYSSSKRNLSIVKIQPIESIFPMQSNLQFKNKAPNYKFIGGSGSTKRNI